VAQRPSALAKSLEAMLLRAASSDEECERLCRETADRHLAAVCVPPRHVAGAVRLLAGGDVRVVALISHPFGADTPEVKYAACRRAIADGADDVEVVVDLAAFASGDPNHIRDELRLYRTALVGARREPTLRAVVETGALDDRHLRLLARAVVAGGADMIVTSSGLAPEAAGELDIGLLREECGAAVGIKAVRAARTAAEVQALLVAGASRVGTTHADTVLGER
jgi:deoxyribose-phosphate aldolase